MGEAYEECRVPVGEASEECRVPVGEACEECRVPVGEASEAESQWERHWRKPSPSGRGIRICRVSAGEAVEESGVLGSALNDSARVGLLLERMWRVSSDMVIRWPQLIIISI
ncbi:hypothetical protein Adt_20156 [Abeliophyllum distichum]|uniref:Uncharacterized protein n=1 Tax=Abeliophyllum distichum TaxID=126358 RepID=A0ABD1SVS4_9LAMI